MKIYSDFPRARASQIVADVTAIAGIVLFATIGFTLHALITTFADLGRRLEAAGTGFRITMTDAADALGRLPLVGEGVRSPFDGASGAGRALENAGTAQQVLVAQLALLLGLAVAVVPIAIILRYWLRRRIAFARRASAAAALTHVEGGFDLLALRALAAAPPRDVMAVDRNAAEAWRARDERVIRQLAGIALTEAGVRLP